ncbi:hypothetical protein R3W88_026456 [Solanum pinnatisectum]|uniref:Uncharacterized protein n=1 Tax=Solanum pinnatisectum TaxID=50273 RepID=A0AAV9LEC8_9SOLN|nr:hypothetical protein R3W88_026456 [Solanum pinnatisectum]
MKKTTYPWLCQEWFNSINTWSNKTRLKIDPEFTEVGVRLVAEETWARSLTPPADSRGGNKRPADRCEFYSRGWFINRSSCRFLLFF